MSNINDFFREPNNSHAREKILNHHLWFDLEKAAAQDNYELQVYRPDTDHVGVDVFLDDLKTIRGFQIKTVLNDAKTVDWEIHSRLLQPKVENMKSFKCSIPVPGIEGGVILIVIDVDEKKNDFSVSYEYFDIYILKMYIMKMCSHKRCKTFDKACELHKQLTISTNEIISIPRTMFIKPKNAACLLALAGLNSECKEMDSYRNLLKKISINVKQGPEYEEIITNFKALVDTSDLII